MNVFEQIKNDFNQALKAKDELVILVLRQIKTAVTNAEIIKNREEVTEEELIKLLRSEVKKRKESARLYEQGKRAELAEKELKEIKIIKKYLPPELGEEAIEQKIQAIVEKLGASGPQDTGRVMGAVMKELAGQADGNVVSKLVKEALSPKE